VESVGEEDRRLVADLLGHADDKGDVAGDGLGLGPERQALSSTQSTKSAASLKSAARASMLTL
jgi:hypothetical protein